LKVRAGIDGVLVDLPLQVGQHLQPGTMLAKVVQPDHLMAALKIAETQARDVQFGETGSHRYPQWSDRGDGDARGPCRTEWNRDGGRPNDGRASKRELAPT